MCSPARPERTGGAFCLYQRTQVLFPFRRGRKGRPGPPFSLPSLSQRDLTIKGLRSLRRLRLQARSLGQINTARRGSKARGRGLHSPLPAIPERARFQQLVLAPRAALGRLAFRGALLPRPDGDGGVRLCAEREPGTGHAGRRNLLPSTRSSRTARFLPKLNFFEEGQSVWTL